MHQPASYANTMSCALETIIKKDPLVILTQDEKDMVWNARRELVHFPYALPKLLLSVDWTNMDLCKEAISYVAIL
jgi:hypothetical protein